MPQGKTIGKKASKDGAKKKKRGAEAGNGEGEEMAPIMASRRLPKRNVDSSDLRGKALKGKGRKVSARDRAAHSIGESSPNSAPEVASTVEQNFRESLECAMRQLNSSLRRHDEQLRVLNENLRKRGEDESARHDQLLAKEERTAGRFEKLMGVFSNMHELLEKNISVAPCSSVGSARDARESSLVTSAGRVPALPSIVLKPSGKPGGKDKRSAYMNVVAEFNREVQEMRKRNVSGSDKLQLLTEEYVRDAQVRNAPSSFLLR